MSPAPGSRLRHRLREIFRRPVAVGAIAVVTLPLGSGLLADRPMALPRTLTAPLGAPHPVSVYLVPHQNDEVVSMGAFIAADLEAGKRVHLVFVGDGHSAPSRDGLCSKEKICLTPQGQTRARHREALESAKALGVAERNVQFLDLPESGFASKDVTAVVKGQLARHGREVTYNTTSWLDKDPDHRILGRTLDAMCGARYQCRFMMSPLHVPGTPVQQKSLPALPRGQWQADTTGRVKRAAQSYFSSDHARGLYGLGGTYAASGPLEFVAATGRNYVHLGSSRFVWRTDRWSAERWLTEPMAVVKNALPASRIPVEGPQGGTVMAVPVVIDTSNGTQRLVVAPEPSKSATPSHSAGTIRAAWDTDLRGDLAAALERDPDGALRLLEFSGSAPSPAGSCAVPGHADASVVAAGAGGPRGTEILLWGPDRRQVSSLVGTCRTGFVQGRSMQADLPDGATSVVVGRTGKDGGRPVVSVDASGSLHVGTLGQAGGISFVGRRGASVPAGSQVLGLGRYSGAGSTDLLVRTPTGLAIVRDVMADAPGAVVVPIVLSEGQGVDR